MTNVVQFRLQRKPTNPPPESQLNTQNLHIIEEGVYSLEFVAVGISIATELTKDFETALFLMEKFKEAVIDHEIYVYLSLEETRRYLDYLDIHRSPKNTELRIALAMSIYS